MDGFGAGLACGIGCGLAIGIGSGKTRGQAAFHEKLKSLFAKDEIQVVDRDGKRITEEALMSMLTGKSRSTRG